MEVVNPDIQRHNIIYCKPGTIFAEPDLLMREFQEELDFKHIKPVTIDGMIKPHAQQFPEKIAINHNSENITYRDLEQRSNQIAAYLTGNQIGVGDIVAVAMDRSIPMAVVLLAILKTGAAYLPIDPRLPPHRVQYTIKDCAAQTLITTNKYAELYKGHPRKLIFDDTWLKYSGYQTTPRDVERNGNNTAYVIYTSGSTGVPKGVAISHNSLLNLLISIQHTPGITRDDIMLGITTISFDISQLELFLPLISGAQLTMVDDETAKDGRELLDIIRNKKISIVQATPFTWQMMLEAGWEGYLPIKAFCGGEAMTKDLAIKLLARCNELWNMYGPTETTIYSTIKKISANDTVISIGTPIQDTRVYILDELLNEKPKGDIGEIYIGGAGVAIGYINNAALTSAKFIADKFLKIPGQKIYRTGDLGKILNNGDIQCLGRIDQQIKIRGYRVETEEIEYLLKQQKNIKNALVILHKDAVENLRLIAYIVPSRFENCEAAKCIPDWKKTLKSLLPDYMVPNDYVVIAEIPLMTNGKIDRSALPDPEIKNHLSSYLAPNTDLEKDIREIWINNIGIKNIGINNNFFDLGGNSLIAAKTMIQIEKLTGRRLPIATLFRYPTIEELSAIIQNNKIDNSYTSLIPIKPNGTKTPLYLIHGIGLNLLNFRDLALNMDAEQPVYGMQAVGLYGIREPLDNLKKIAAFYNQEIIRFDPVGPYAIAGYSFGGYVAFEMVRQLKEMGKDVKILAMLDTNIQEPTHQYPLTKKILKKIARQLPKAKFRFLSFFKYPSENIIYLKAYCKRWLMDFLKSFGFVKKYRLQPLPDFMELIASKLEAAFFNHVFMPYDVKIELFRAEKRMYYVDDPLFLGWKKYALKGVSVHHIPGDHNEMLGPPSDKILASILQNLLDKAN